MADITMSLEDTLELDTIIEKSSRVLNSVGTIKYEGSDSTVHNSEGIQTGTFIFDPQEPGSYTIPVNGQELTVKVKYLSTIHKSVFGRWPLNKGSGTTASNTIASKDLSFSGSPTWKTDSNAIGNFVLSLDGNDYLTASPYTEIKYNTSFSIGVTFNIDKSDASESDTIIANETTDSAFSLTLEGTNGDLLSANIRNKNNDKYTGRATSLFDYGVKQRAVVTFDGSSRMTLYINSSGTTSGKDNLRFGSTGFVVGARGGGINRMIGDLDEIFISDVEMTASEVQDDYDRQPWS